MLALFVFKSSERGTQYGIKTYLKYLTSSLLSKKSISIYLVNFHSIEHREFTVKNMVNRLTEIYIPSIRINKGSCDRERNEQKYFARVVDLLNIIIRKHPHVVFLVNYPNTLPLVKELKSRFSYPIISVIHATAWHFGFNGNKKKFIEFWGKNKNSNDDLMKLINCEKELYELTDKTISVTKYMKEFIVKYYGIPRRKISVIYNGIDNSDFQILSINDKYKKKRQLGFDPDEKIVLFSGRLDAGKGLYILLDSFVEVVRRKNNVRLILIGEDSGKDKICNYLTRCENIWNKVTFTGFLKYEKVLEFYQIADVGIIPSLYEQCPYVALEMIGHKIPLIISNIEGLNEILTKDQSIYLNPVVDHEGNISFYKEQIADAILSLTNGEKQKIDSITADYSKLVNTKFSSKQMGKNLSFVLESVSKIALDK